VHVVIENIVEIKSSNAAWQWSIADLSHNFAQWIPTYKNICNR